jgi:hypothetical protein
MKWIAISSLSIQMVILMGIWVGGLFFKIDDSLKIQMIASSMVPILTALLWLVWRDSK